MEIGQILLLYLCMAIAVVCFFPQTVLNEDNNSLLSIFHLYYNETTNSVDITQSGFADSGLNLETGSTETESGFWKRGLEGASQFFQSFVDGLQNVLGAIKILFRFLFSPFIFVMNPELMGEAPFFVKLIFALPLVFIALITVIKFIRGIQ